MNSISLIGLLRGKPIEIKKNPESSLKVYEFEIFVKREDINLERKHDLFKIKTYSLNLEKHLSILKKDFILGVQGRLISEDDQTFVFADNLHFLGSKK